MPLPGSMVKNLCANAGDLGSITGSGRSPGEGNGNTLRHPCLGNPIDRGAWRATVCGDARTQTQLRTKPQPGTLAACYSALWNMGFSSGAFMCFRKQFSLL